MTRKLTASLLLALLLVVLACGWFVLKLNSGVVAVAPALRSAYRSVAMANAYGGMNDVIERIEQQSAYVQSQPLPARLSYYRSIALSGWFDGTSSYYYDLYECIDADLPALHADLVQLKNSTHYSKLSQAEQARVDMWIDHLPDVIRSIKESPPGQTPWGTSTILQLSSTKSGNALQTTSPNAMQLLERSAGMTFPPEAVLVNSGDGGGRDASYSFYEWAVFSPSAIKMPQGKTPGVQDYLKSPFLEEAVKFVESRMTNHRISQAQTGYKSNWEKDGFEFRGTLVRCAEGDYLIIERFRSP